MATTSTDREPATGTVAPRVPARLPRLIRSVAHRLANDDLDLPVEGRLPGFDGATGWLNARPLTPEGLRGRVVLVDFWTYTCINWLRTLPYLRAWHAKYESLGLTVVGVHTPEFGFERDVDNVTAQTRHLRVEYPVAIDSDYAIWGAFANHFWPAVYVADAEGRIRFHHFGEGEYAATEMVIQQLLADARGTDVDRDLVDVEPQGFEVAADWRTLRSPETYLGYGRSSGFASPEAEYLGAPHRYDAPGQLTLNTWALSGTWTLAQHAAIASGPGGRIAFRFAARDAHLVMGPAERGSSVPFRVLLDGAAPGESAGEDVAADGSGTVADQRLYGLIRQSGPVRERLLEVEFLEAGVEAYCFTFG